jgi:hypothetical protein
MATKRTSTPKAKKAPRKPTVSPTTRGLQLLGLIAEQRACTAVEWDDTLAGNRAQRKYHRIGDNLTRLGRAIMRTRVTSLSALVDRAILSVWWCSPYAGVLFGSGDMHGFHEGAVVAVLKMAGIKPAQCNPAL